MNLAFNMLAILVGRGDSSVKLLKNTDELKVLDFSFPLFIISFQGTR